MTKSTVFIKTGRVRKEEEKTNECKKIVQGVAKGIMKEAGRKLDNMERESGRSGRELNDKYYRARESYDNLKRKGY